MPTLRVSEKSAQPSAGAAEPSGMRQNRPNPAAGKPEAPRPWGKLLGSSVLCLVCLISSGCSSGWQLGRDHYRDARYPDAVREFREAAADYSQLDRDEQAHYALYRGLTHLAVGDALAADGWLRIAKHESDRNPRLFSPDELGRLDSAWRSLGRMPGEGAVGPAWLAGREQASPR